MSTPRHGQTAFDSQTFQVSTAIVTCGRSDLYPSVSCNVGQNQLAGALTKLIDALDQTLRHERASKMRTLETKYAFGIVPDFLALHLIVNDES